MNNSSQVEVQHLLQPCLGSGDTIPTIRGRSHLCNWTHTMETTVYTNDSTQVCVEQLVSNHINVFAAPWSVIEEKFPMVIFWYWFLYTSGSEKKTPYFIGTYSSQSGDDLRRSQVRLHFLYHSSLKWKKKIAMRLTYSGWQRIMSSPDPSDWNTHCLCMLVFNCQTALPVLPLGLFFPCYLLTICTMQHEPVYLQTFQLSPVSFSLVYTVQPYP